LEQKKQELKIFMAINIAQLIEEQESRSKIFNDSNPTVEVKRTLENPKNIELYILDKEEILSRNPRE
jgi:hypothetical protein